MATRLGKETDMAMQNRFLGRTGVSVSPLCLGAMMFGPWGNKDEADSIRIIHRALDAGINFVDTADVYSGGESERIVGRALAGRRDGVVLATKFFMPMDGGDPNQRGGSRRWIIREVENSLRRLDTDYIDLYQVHRPSQDTDVEETLGALTVLVRQGKVRYIGSSSYAASQIVEAQWTARDRRLERFVTEQPPYSILVRGIEADVLPTARRHGMGILSYSPLGGGWLSGRWRKDAASAPTSAARPLRHGQLREPAQARHRRTARAARRQGGPDAHRAGHRVRHQPPRRHRRDHRPAHHGTARVPAVSRRGHPDRGHPRPDRSAGRPRGDDEP
jgi:aryl-alcohol dehydrogenase-like predicted oxidoreductase